MCVVIITNTCANSEEPYETARNEPSHQDQHCLPFCVCVFFFLILIIHVYPMRNEPAHDKT